MASLAYRHIGLYSRRRPSGEKRKKECNKVKRIDGEESSIRKDLRSTTWAGCK